MSRRQPLRKQRHGGKRVPQPGQFAQLYWRLFLESEPEFRVWFHRSHAPMDVCRANDACPYKRIIVYQLYKGKRSACAQESAQLYNRHILRTDGSISAR